MMRMPTTAGNAFRRRLPVLLQTERDVCPCLSSTPALRAVASRRSSSIGNTRIHVALHRLPTSVPPFHPVFTRPTVPSTSRMHSSSNTIPEAEISPRRTPPNQEELWEAHVREWDPKLESALQRHQELTDKIEALSDDEQHSANLSKQTLVDSLTALQECYHQLRYYADAVRVDTDLLKLLLGEDRDSQSQRAHAPPDNDDDRKSQIATVYMRLGNHSYHAKQFEEARRYLQAAMDMFLDMQHALGDAAASHRESIARALNGMALAYMYEDDSDRALQYFQQAEEQYRNFGESGDPSIDNKDSDIASWTPSTHPDIVKVLSNQAILHRREGHSQQALIKYRELEEFLDPDDVLGRQQLDLDIGDCYNELQNLTEARYSFENVLQSIKEQEYKVGEEPGVEALARRKYGEVLIKQDRLDQAMNELGKAYRITKRLVGDDSMDAAKCLNALGVCHARKGSTGDALTYFREFLVIARMNSAGNDPHDPMIQNALKNISLVQKRDKQQTAIASKDEDGGGGGTFS